MDPLVLLEGLTLQLDLLALTLL